MGLLDGAGNLFNRGVASAGRTTRSITLKAQISDLGQRRESIAAQLGANLFLTTQNDPKFRVPFEDLYISIENLDIQIASLQEELTNLEMQAQMAAGTQPMMMTDQPILICPSCGENASTENDFCTSCGMSLVEIKQSMRLCPACRFVLVDSDRFCTNCGLEIPSIPDETVAPGFNNQVEASNNEIESADDSISTNVVQNDEISGPLGESHPNLCQSCGYENVSKAKFCRRCGEKI